MDGFCIFLGYSVQHTFISFFLWMSAMAMNMTYKFSDIFKVLAVLTMLTKFVVLVYSPAGDDHFVAIDGHGHEHDLPIDDQVVDIDDPLFKEESKEHQKTLVAITAYSQVLVISITH